MKTVEVRVPDIGDFRDVEVIELMVGEGDRIARDQSLVLVESDKASMEIPSPQAGIVREMKVKLGDRISEGSLLLLLDVDDASETATVSSKSAMEKILPTSATLVFAEETSPYSCTSRPMKCPSRWVKFGPYPASSMIWRAALSTSQSGTPGFRIASAAAFARRTVS